MRHVKIRAQVVTLLALTVLATLLVANRAGGSEGFGLTPAARNGDMVAFSRDLLVVHPVGGDVVLMNGSATIDAPVNGDVVVLGGGVIFRGQGRVTGDLVCLGGSVTGAEGRVGGDFYAPRSLHESLIHAMPGRDRQGLMAILAVTLKLALLLVWMLATIFVTMAGGREIRQASLEVRASPLHTFAVGLAGYTSLILTAILFSTLIPFVIGIPLLIVEATFAIMAKVFGTIAVFHSLGTFLAGARTREQLAGRKLLRGDLAMALVGLMVLGAIRLIPVVGTIVWGVASLFGMGTALATAFGRREPWFLAARPVES